MTTEGDADTVDWRDPPIFGLTWLLATLATEPIRGSSGGDIRQFLA